MWSSFMICSMAMTKVSFKPLICGFSLSFFRLWTTNKKESSVFWTKSTFYGNMTSVHVSRWSSIERKYAVFSHSIATVGNPLRIRMLWQENACAKFWSRVITEFFIMLFFQLISSILVPSNCLFRRVWICKRNYMPLCTSFRLAGLW